MAKRARLMQSLRREARGPAAGLHKGRGLGSRLRDRDVSSESSIFGLSGRQGGADHRYTANKSAFDVFIAYEGPSGRNFLGVKVKYHESLKGRRAPAPSKHASRGAMRRRGQVVSLRSGSKSGRRAGL